MAVFKNFKDDELIVSCKCGCDEGIHFKIHDEDGDERPVRLWVTSVEKISVDATNVIENACSDLHEDAYERCDEGSLQKLLDDWCKEQTGTTTYYPCYKQYVEINWSKYEDYSR